MPVSQGKERVHIHLPHVLNIVANRRPVCGIVYSPRKTWCDEIARRLRNDGVVAASYHAGMDPKERERVLAAWVDGTTLGVVVATVAFGMGVDRGEVPPLHNNGN